LTTRDSEYKLQTITVTTVSMTNITEQKDEGDNQGDNVKENEEEEKKGNSNQSSNSNTEQKRKNEEESEKDDPPTVLVERPTKRARSLYFIFADEMRPSIRKEFPGENVGTQAKRIGQKWKEITPIEKEKYQKMAAEEKKQIADQLEAYKKQMGDEYVELDGKKDSSGLDPNALIFPVARISKIAKLDPDVNAIQKEAMQLIVKTSELFLSRMGHETVKVAAIYNRRTLHASDLVHICQHRNEFQFLKDDMKDYSKELTKQKETEGDTTAAVVENKKDMKRVAAAAGSKPLTSYFASSSKK